MNNISIIPQILTVLFFILAPAGILLLCRKVSILGKIGPVLLLYVIGIIFGNTVHTEGMAAIQEALSSATVPLAIPLMLFACTISKTQTRDELLALITGLIAIIIAVFAGYFLFGRNVEDGAKVGGMLTGVYTGGTVNLAALKNMLDVPDETFLLINSYDMAICFLYITFLLGFGIKIIRKILPCNSLKENSDSFDTRVQEESSPYKGMFTKDGLKDVSFLLLADVLIIGVSALLGFLAGNEWFMIVLILSLTTLGIAGSFCKKIKTKKYGYDVGMYLIYIFSIVVASMADLQNLNLKDSLEILGYLSFVIFGSLLIQVILAKLFKVDADMVTVSSVTYICSPPFVPMIVGAMKNKRVLAGGLAIGVVGYAVGNYLGFIISRILALL